MQNVLPRSGARAYTVSDDASADQRYINMIIIGRSGVCPLCLSHLHLCLIVNHDDLQAEWLWTLMQTIDAAVSSKRKASVEMARGCLSLPRDRNSYHVFTKHPLYKHAKYKGLWRDGKVHGQWVRFTCINRTQRSKRVQTYGRKSRESNMLPHSWSN